MEAGRFPRRYVAIPSCSGHMELEENLKATVELPKRDDRVVPVFFVVPNRQDHADGCPLPGFWKSRYCFERVVLSGTLDQPVVVEVCRCLTGLRYAPTQPWRPPEKPNVKPSGSPLASGAPRCIATTPCNAVAITSRPSIRASFSKPKFGQVLLEFHINRDTGAVGELAKLLFVAPLLEAEREEDGEHDHHCLDGDLGELPAQTSDSGAGCRLLPPAAGASFRPRRQ